MLVNILMENEKFAPTCRHCSQPMCFSFQTTNSSPPILRAEGKLKPSLATGTSYKVMAGTYIDIVYLRCDVK